MVAIPVTLGHTVVGEAGDERTGRRRDAGARTPGGGRWLLVHRGGAAGGASLGRCGRRAGGPVQAGGAGGGRATARGRPEDQVRRGRAGADPGRGTPHARPGAGPDGDLVGDDAPAGAAERRGRAARGQPVHHLVRAARGGPELAAGPVVVPHRAGEAAAQARRGRGPRSGRDRKKGLIERASTQPELPVWTEDEAGPYQAIPQPGTHWRPTTSP